MRGRPAGKSRPPQRRRSISRAKLEAMIEDATVDAYGEAEQLVVLYTMLGEHLAVPFETTLLGAPVTVKGVDLTRRDEIVAVCSRGRFRQAIPILDLVLPSPAPVGAEWIEAYRYWVGGGL